MSAVCSFVRRFVKPRAELSAFFREIFPNKQLQALVRHPEVTALLGTRTRGTRYNERRHTHPVLGRHGRCVNSKESIEPLSDLVILSTATSPSNANRNVRGPHYGFATVT